MIADIDTAPWMKGIAIEAASKGIAILGFLRYRSHWYVMIYGQTDDNGYPLWAGVRAQEFIDGTVWKKPDIKSRLYLNLMDKYGEPF